MPDPDGYAILRSIRSRPGLRDIPVLVMTSLEGDDEPTRAFAAGADDFIRKPIRPAEVIARIRGQLRIRDYMDALERRERDAQVVLELTQALSSSLDFRVVALAGLSAILLLHRHWNIAGVLAVSSAAALVMKFALG